MVGGRLLSLAPMSEDGAEREGECKRRARCGPETSLAQLNTGLDRLGVRVSVSVDPTTRHRVDHQA